MKRLTITILLLITITLLHAQNFLDSLKQDHPRLLFLEEDVQRINTLAETDTLLAELISIVHSYADEALIQPLIAYEYDGPGDPRLKRERRAAMFRIFNCGVTYRLTGDTVYANRIKKELLSAAGFPDWGPQHFLNIGEISTLVAIGYDWVYELLTPLERDSIRKAIIEFSLKEGERAYQGTHPESWWVTEKNNWNQVCNGGLVLAAMAIAEDEADWANYILENALASIPSAMEGYVPDGAWYEGPTYWAYGTTYNALFFAGIATALQNTVDVTAINGYQALGKSGNFHIQTVGPSNLYFNFGDSKTTLYFSPVLFWLSKIFDKDVYAWYERWICSRDIPRMHEGILMQDDTLDRFLALLVVWYNDKGKQLSYDDLPLDVHFRGEAAIGAMRSGWSEDALYVGFKGGYNQANHGHLDIGSFVLDANQVRWAMDLGGDDYDLPGYFDSSGDRWQYFRLNNYGHNTLTIGGLQHFDALVAIDSFSTALDSAHAFIDMTDAYARYSDQVIREFKMENRQNVIVKDKIIGTPFYFSIRWNMVTEADIELFGNQALLSMQGKTMKVEIVEPAEKNFTILSTDPGDDLQDPNEGTSRLAIEFGQYDISDTINIVVKFTPEGAIMVNLPAEEIHVDNNFELFDNYPNPFNPLTTIRYQISQAGNVKLDIFDISGRKVRTLVNSNQSKGHYKIVWNGKNNAGADVSSGLYLYRLQSKNRDAVKKMMLIH